MANTLFPVGPTLGDDTRDTIPCAAPDVHDAPTMPSLPVAANDVPVIVPCDECGGRGQYEVEDYGVFGGPGSARMVTCDRCEGTGDEPHDDDDLSPLLVASIAKVRRERGR